VSGEELLDRLECQAERVAERAGLAATSERQFAAERHARKNLAAELAAERARRAGSSGSSAGEAGAARAGPEVSPQIQPMSRRAPEREQVGSS
jgi:hypothetical protein